MNMFILDSEVYVRLGGFFGIFFLMAFWEFVSPKRNLSSSKPLRWFNNLFITFFNTFFIRFVFPLSAVIVAVTSEKNGWGILNNIPLDRFSAGVISIFLLDLAIYTQHVVFHRVTPLWRLHMVHHTDLDIDVTTGARFHPVEIALSMAIKMGIVASIGAPPWSVIAFEVLLNATSMFNHSNVSMPFGLDRILRLFIVTPDMHRVHHSVIIHETNSNFGFNLPWWDRIFGTYRAQPKEGHTGMKIGLSNYRRQQQVNLPQMVALPFTAKSEYLKNYSRGK